MAIKIVKFSDVPVGAQFFLQQQGDWNCFRKFNATKAQRETVLLGVPLGELLVVPDDRKCKLID
jgi:hypothetical protein